MATNTDLKIAIDTAIAASVKRDGLGTHPDVCRDIFRIILKENEGAKGIKFQAERIFACRTPARMREYKAQKAANAALQELAGKLGMSNYNPTDNTYTKNVPNSYLWKLTQLANRVIGSAVIAADTQKVREFIRLGADITDSSVVDPILLTFVMRQTPESRSIETALPMAKAAILANDVQGMTLAGYVSRHVPLTSPLYREVVGKAAVDITPLPVSIATLPDDCWQSILLQLPLADAVRSSQVCHYFHDLVDNDDFYLRLLQRDLPHHKPMAPAQMPYQRQYALARQTDTYPLDADLVRLLGGQEAVDALPLFDLKGHFYNYIHVEHLTAPIMRGSLPIRGFLEDGPLSREPFIVLGLYEGGKYRAFSIYRLLPNCWVSDEQDKEMETHQIDFSGCSNFSDLLSQILGHKPDQPSAARLLNTQELQYLELASLISKYKASDKKARERAALRCRELLKQGIDVCAKEEILSYKSIAYLARSQLPCTSDLYREIAMIAMHPDLVKLLC